ncbi:MAG: hypothetical protein HYY55_02860 [Candidatus Niyogibacteria bacterium]|nr:MAG: hypothetical protein HYY55_02860 [Candidatus Niyogibacteria bacterium]
MPKPAGQYRIVIFLDVNAGEIKRELEGFSPLVKIVHDGDNFNRLSDRKLLRRFETMAAKDYRESRVFVLTHDQSFEEGTEFDYQESRIAIIKMPSPSLGQFLFEQAVADLKSFLNLFLSLGRPTKLHGIFHIE